MPYYNIQGIIIKSPIIIPKYINDEVKNPFNIETDYYKQFDFISNISNINRIKFATGYNEDATPSNYLYVYYENIMYEIFEKLNLPHPYINDNSLSEHFGKSKSIYSIYSNAKCKYNHLNTSFNHNFIRDYDILDKQIIDKLGLILNNIEWDWNTNRNNTINDIIDNSIKSYLCIEKIGISYISDYSKYINYNISEDNINHCINFNLPIMKYPDDDFWKFITYVYTKNELSNILNSHNNNICWYEHLEKFLKVNPMDDCKIKELINIIESELSASKKTKFNELIYSLSDYIFYDNNDDNYIYDVYKDILKNFYKLNINQYNKYKINYENKDYLIKIMDNLNMNEAIIVIADELEIDINKYKNEYNENEFNILINKLKEIENNRHPSDDFWEVFEISNKVIKPKLYYDDKKTINNDCQNRIGYYNMQNNISYAYCPTYINITGAKIFNWSDIEKDEENKNEENKNEENKKYRYYYPYGIKNFNGKRRNKYLTNVMFESSELMKSFEEEYGDEIFNFKPDISEESIKLFEKIKNEYDYAVFIYNTIAMLKLEIPCNYLNDLIYLQCIEVLNLLECISNKKVLKVNKMNE